MKNSENLPKIIFILYLFIGFVPYFGSVDIIGPQWVYLSILNLISLFYILWKGDIFFNKYISFSFISLILFTLLSFFKSINISESIVEFTRIFIFIISVFILFNLSNYISNFLSWILKLVFVVLVFELIFFYFNYYLTYDTIVDKRGVAGNINITAMSLVIKLALIISNFFLKNSRYFLNLIIIFFSFLAIFIIGSRTSFLSLLVLVLSVIIYTLSNKAVSFKPLFILLFSFLLSFFTASSFKSDANNLQSPINFTLSDTSANERVSYYNEAFSLFLDNPFLGIGLGNWKIVSIDTHSKYIQSYFIPYHVHNDFLQFLSETGFFGFLSFISLFFFLFLFSYNIYKHQKFSHELYFVYVALVCYIIDSLLNFPMARPLMLTSFAIIIIFILNHVKTFSKSVRFSSSLFIPILILISLSTVVSTYFVYDSFSKQTYLLNDFRAQKFDTDISIIKDINSVYPNITATGLPIEALKSNYFMNNIDTTLILLNKASKANPYIMYPEFLKSIQLLKLNQFDSALYYSKKAFYSLPNNEFHAVNYLKNLSFKNDSLEMDRVYKITAPMNSKAIIYTYLNERSLTTFKLNDPRFLKIIDSNADIIEKHRLEPLKLIYKYGFETVKNINSISTKGEESFDSKKYLKAANYFLKAYEIIPDPSYLENAAHSYFLANYNNNAENILYNLISNKLSKSGKAHYLYGLLQFEISNKNRGCDFLTESLRMGYKDSAQAIKQLCK